MLNKQHFTQHQTISNNTVYKYTNKASNNTNPNNTNNKTTKLTNKFTNTNTKTKNSNTNSRSTSRLSIEPTNNITNNHTHTNKPLLHNLDIIKLSHVKSSLLVEELIYNKPLDTINSDAYSEKQIVRNNSFKKANIHSANLSRQTSIDSINSHKRNVSLKNTINQRKIKLEIFEEREIRKLEKVIKTLISEALVCSHKNSNLIINDFLKRKNKKKIISDKLLASLNMDNINTVFSNHNNDYDIYTQNKFLCSLGITIKDKYSAIIDSHKAAKELEKLGFKINRLDICNDSCNFNTTTTNTGIINNNNESIVNSNYYSTNNNTNISNNNISNKTLNFNNTQTKNIVNKFKSNPILQKMYSFLRMKLIKEISLIEEKKSTQTIKLIENYIHNYNTDKVDSPDVSNIEKISFHHGNNSLYSKTPLLFIAKNKEKNSSSGGSVSMKSKKLISVEKAKKIAELKKNEYSNRKQRLIKNEYYAKRIDVNENPDYLLSIAARKKQSPMYNHLKAIKSAITVERMLAKQVI